MHHSCVPCGTGYRAPRRAVFGCRRSSFPRACLAVPAIDKTAFSGHTTRHSRPISPLPSQRKPPMSGPLAGVRVLELAPLFAGPRAGQVLADLGADVIKVERSKTVDDTRAWGPPFIEGKDGHLGAAYFHATNRGKRSIECDFETEDGKRIVRKLAAKSDILIENFKAGGLAKVRLDYQSLKDECPRLIYCSVTGFGQDGPYAQRARDD